LHFGPARLVIRHPVSEASTLYFIELATNGEREPQAACGRLRPRETPVTLTGRGGGGRS
jgi:hypothetical protein